ncbi:DUF1918 domain-containing protein [Leifsonia virtsii]|uniref:DUF1918 domain-containing protein n=1 Tax=Leifsonia virtsii TaxID=3035915 RepID=A0ABT8IWF6_9MICO|nr:DUF1918 domain-containing protein [Leifsonia virtsii]MDN4597135.1 DUF1918 domain-containing protein [Leifsonia virtsii]
MQAHVGDFLIIASNHLEGPARVGLIQEVHGEGGAPPYQVRWEDDERTTLVFPGPDAHIEHRGDSAAASGAHGH